MNSFKVYTCTKCDNCKVDNYGKEWDERNFYITCNLDVWEGQKSVRISDQFHPIPNNCPLIEKENDEDY